MGYLSLSLHIRQIAWNWLALLLCVYNALDCAIWAPVYQVLFATCNKVTSQCLVGHNIVHQFSTSTNNKFLGIKENVYFFFQIRMHYFIFLSLFRFWSFNVQLFSRNRVPKNVGIRIYWLDIKHGNLIWLIVLWSSIPCLYSNDLICCWIN